jgi:hypothetical protein
MQGGENKEESGHPPTHTHIHTHTHTSATVVALPMVLQIGTLHLQVPFPTSCIMCVRITIDLMMIYSHRYPELYIDTLLKVTIL